MERVGQLRKIDGHTFQITDVYPAPNPGYYIVKYVVILSKTGRPGKWKKLIYKPLNDENK